MASCADASSSAAQFVITNCASTWNDSNSFLIGERQERGRPPPATELTNTVTEDSRRIEEASARSFMQLFLSYSRWNHGRLFWHEIGGHGHWHEEVRIGAGGGNRTHGLGIMRPSLYH